MPQPLEQRLASELSIRPQQVQATIALLDEDDLRGAAPNGALEAIIPDGSLWLLA